MQNNGASTLVEYYDPNNNKWHNGAPLPRALTHVGLAASAINYTPSADSPETCTSKHRRMRSCTTR